MVRRMGVEEDASADGAGRPPPGGADLHRAWRARASGQSRRTISIRTSRTSCNVIKFEDLDDIVLLGHSYGGMVATGVADRARERVTQLIYLDAFVPGDGQSLFDLNEGGASRCARQQLRVMVIASRRIRRRRIRRRPSSTGSTRDASTCRSNVSRRRLKLDTASRDAAAQLHLLPGAFRRPTCSGSSRSARRTRRAGAISRSTPVIRRTSPRRRR